ncbi:hypothetical protein [Hydrogenophaga sp. PBC]|uniref:hypothetical protein n=1 Tax=Hydrogenophaga sp. PBC TaxID=795665 RepID=UPI0002608B98
MTASKPETSAIGHAKQVRPTRRRSPASLALRVTALIGAAITLVFLCFQWAIVRSLEHHFAQQDAHELDAVISALAEPLRQGDDMDRDALGQQLANAVASRHCGRMQIVDGRSFGSSEAGARQVMDMPFCRPISHDTPPPRTVAASC